MVCDMTRVLSDKTVIILHNNFSNLISIHMILQKGTLIKHPHSSYIPDKNETVYLKENSNISTGGDSIDFTDEVHEQYKTIATNAAKAVGAKICGADIIIRDIHAPPTKTTTVS
jgi:D-alanine-D-alanine ligase-like ATP-grasp enzyme